MRGYPRGDGCARILVFQMQFDQWRRAQSQPRRVSLREGVAQQTIEQDLRLEFGAGRGELNVPDHTAKIEPLAAFCRRAQYSLQATAQVRRFADIWLAVTSQHEHRGTRREFLKETLVVI